MKLETERLKFQKDGLFMVHSGPVLSLDFSLDNRLLASGDQQGTVKVWKLADGKCLRQINIELSRNLASVTTVRLNPANSKVYACCLDKSIKVFGLKSGTMLKEMAGQHESYIQGFDFLCVKVADNKLVKTDDLVLSYSFDGKVVLWALGPNAKLFPSQRL